MTLPQVKHLYRIRSTRGARTCNASLGMMPPHSLLFTQKHVRQNLLAALQLQWNTQCVQYLLISQAYPAAGWPSTDLSML